MEKEDMLTETLRKVFLAGVGAVAATADKSEEIFHDLVEKGETTVARGRTLNRELKHTVKEAAKGSGEKEASKDPIRDLNAILAGMTADQLDALKEKVDEAREGARGQKSGEETEKREP